MKNRIYRGTKDAPCIDCENKGCGAYHSKCPAYLEFKQEQEQKKAETMQKAIAYNQYMGMIADNHKRKLHKQKVSGK